MKTTKTINDYIKINSIIILNNALISSILNEKQLSISKILFSYSLMSISIYLGLSYGTKESKSILKIFYDFYIKIALVMVIFAFIIIFEKITPIGGSIVIFLNMYVFFLFTTMKQNEVTQKKGENS